jgi:CRP-like cAMP-binding protein
LRIISFPFVYLRMTDKTSLRNFILSHFPCPADILEQMIENFEPFTIAKGELFVREGTMSNTYLFLEKGLMRAFTYDLDGNDVTTVFFGDKQVVFDVGSFFKRDKSKENIQALTDCTGLTISFEELNRLFHTYLQFREFGRMVLVKAYVGLKERTVSLINETAEQRYLNLINTNPEIFQHAPLKIIASYLGVTDSSLSRIRREFQKK